jgi:hypothetical protein
MPTFSLSFLSGFWENQRRTNRPRTYSGRVFFYEAGRKKVRNGHFSSALLTTMQNPVDRRQRDLINIDKSGFQWRVVSVAGCGFFADGYTVRRGISIKTRRCRPR